MKILIAEDDFACRTLLQSFLSEYGDCFVAINGLEAVKAFKNALNECRPYDMICLDIMMPEMDGFEAFKTIRRIENKRGIVGSDGVKVIVTTALDSTAKVLKLFNSGREAYLVKPFSIRDLLEKMEKLGLVKFSESSSIE